MNKTILTSAIIFATGCTANIQAADSGVQTVDLGIEKCITAIQKQKTGELITLEKLNVNGKPVYEFELRDVNGFEWEFMCDVNSGKIIEMESEVSSVNSQAFKSKMIVTEDDAKAIALKAHPGVIEEVEYEIEDNSDATYEFDIINDKGIETKVEVDAATGKIIEVAIEEWEIGEEPDERR